MYLYGILERQMLLKKSQVEEGCLGIVWEKDFVKSLVVYLVFLKFMKKVKLESYIQFWFKGNSVLNCLKYGFLSLALCICFLKNILSSQQMIYYFKKANTSTGS